MCIAIKGYCGRAVSEDFGESFDVHSALERACGKGVTQGVEAPVLYSLTLKYSCIYSLVGSDADVIMPADYHIRCVRHSFISLKYRYYLPRYGYPSFRAFRLGRVDDLLQLAVLVAVTAGSADRYTARDEIDILPLECHKAPYRGRAGHRCGCSRACSSRPPRSFSALRPKST